MAVLATDPDGLTRWCSAKFSQLTGYREEELTGRKPDEVLQTPDTNVQEVKRVSAHLKQGLPVQKPHEHDYR